MLLILPSISEQNSRMQLGNRRDLNLNESSTSLVLFEEHSLVRAALAQNLRMQPDIQLLQASPYLPSRPEDILPLNPEVILIGLPQFSVANMQSLAHDINVWSNAGIGVIVSTPYLKAEEEKLLFEGGIFAYVHKTIDVERLKKVIVAAKTF